MKIFVMLMMVVMISPVAYADECTTVEKDGVTYEVCNGTKPTDGDGIKVEAEESPEGQENSSTNKKGSLVPSSFPLWEVIISISFVLTFVAGVVIHKAWVIKKENESEEIKL